jgi:membrane protein YdbS with pleckstrin-like domain
LVLLMFWLASGVVHWALAAAGASRQSASSANAKVVLFCLSEVVVVIAVSFRYQGWRWPPPRRGIYTRHVAVGGISM